MRTKNGPIDFPYLYGMFALKEGKEKFTLPDRENV
jgi:hypothetical protein